MFFALFLYYVAATMLSNFKPQPSRQLPGTAGMSGVGGIIGVISSLVGIGGGALSIPFMMWCNVPVHNAIGTSAAIGFPIAVAGTLGYIINGVGVTDVPPPLGLPVPPGPLRHRLLQLFYRPLRGPAGSPHPGGDIEAHLRVLPDRRCNPDPLGGVDMTVSLRFGHSEAAPHTEL